MEPILSSTDILSIANPIYNPDGKIVVRAIHYGFDPDAKGLVCIRYVDYTMNDSEVERFYSDVEFFPLLTNKDGYLDTEHIERIMHYGYSCGGRNRITLFEMDFACIEGSPSMMRRKGHGKTLINIGIGYGVLTSQLPTDMVEMVNQASWKSYIKSMMSPDSVDDSLCKKKSKNLAVAFARASGVEMRSECDDQIADSYSIMRYCQNRFDSKAVETLLFIHDHSSQLRKSEEGSLGHAIDEMARALADVGGAYEFANNLVL